VTVLDDGPAGDVQIHPRVGGVVGPQLLARDGQSTVSAVVNEHGTGHGPTQDLTVVDVFQVQRAGGTVQADLAVRQVSHQHVSLLDLLGSLRQTHTVHVGEAALLGLCGSIHLGATRSRRCSGIRWGCSCCRGFICCFGASTKGKLLPGQGLLSGLGEGGQELLEGGLRFPQLVLREEQRAVVQELLQLEGLGRRLLQQSGRLRPVGSGAAGQQLLDGRPLRVERAAEVLALFLRDRLALFGFLPPLGVLRPRLVPLLESLLYLDGAAFARKPRFPANFRHRIHVDALSVVAEVNRLTFFFVAGLKAFTATYRTGVVNYY